MNYGGDAADQVVKYSLDGIEHSLRLSGTLAKHLAVFFVAVLKDQKKTHGKTRMIRMLKEGRPLKFFTVPSDKLKEFGREGKKHGLLYVVIKDKKNPGKCEVMVFADDAAKVNRIMDRMNLDFLTAESAEVAPAPREEQTRQAGEPGQKQTKVGQKDAQEAGKKGKSEPAITQPVQVLAGEVQFEVGDEHEFQIMEEVPEAGNFTNARESDGKGKNPENPSDPSLHNRDSSSGQEKETNKPSVRKELEQIRQEKKEEQKQKERQRSSSKKRNARKRKKKARSSKGGAVR